MQIMSEMGVLDRHYRGVERISGEKSPSIQDGGFVLYSIIDFLEKDSSTKTPQVLIGCLVLFFFLSQLFF